MEHFKHRHQNAYKIANVTRQRTCFSFSLEPTLSQLFSLTSFHNLSMAAATNKSKAAASGAKKATASKKSDHPTVCPIISPLSLLTDARCGTFFL